MCFVMRSMWSEMFSPIALLTWSLAA